MILFAAIKILWYKKGKMDGNDIFYSVEEKYFKRKIIQIIRMWYKSVTSKDIQLILYFFGETKNFSLSKKKKKEIITHVISMIQRHLFFCDSPFAPLLSLN